MVIQKNTITKKEVVEISTAGICCSEKMSCDGDEYLCKICGKYERILEHMMEEPKSQGIKFYDNGKKVFGSGDPVKKTESEKIKDLQDEFVTKISNGNNGAIIDNSISYPVACLAYSVFKKSNKKIGNRNQVFGYCWKIVSESMGVTVHAKEIKKVLKLEKTGVGKGKSFLGSAFIEKTKNDRNVDLNTIYGYNDVYAGGRFTQININPDMIAVLVADQLSILDENYPQKKQFKKFNSKKNRKFCTELVEFMQCNTICYNVFTRTVCGGVVYYLLEKFYSSFLYKMEFGKRKKLIPKNILDTIIDVQQNSFTGVNSTLNLEIVQRILPEKFKSSQTLIPKIVMKICDCHDLCIELFRYVEYNAICADESMNERCRCVNDYVNELVYDIDPPKTKLYEVLNYDCVQKVLSPRLVSKKYVETLFKQFRKTSSVSDCLEIWTKNTHIECTSRNLCEAIDYKLSLDEGLSKNVKKSVMEISKKLVF